MARVNLEERLFGDARLRHLARKLNCLEHTALGLVAMLWHDSQEMGAVYATSEEILVWCRYDDIAHHEWMILEVTTQKEDVIRALIDTKFIDQVDEDKFLIRGNEKQIQQVRAFKERAHKAADKRWGKVNATSNAQADAIACSSNAQYNSIQDNSIQTNTEKKRSEQVIEELAGIDDECFSQVTPSAQRAWVREFGIEAVRNIVPTAHAAWSSQNPKSRQGVPVPLPIYVRRCLENYKRYPRGEPTRGIAELLAERDEKEKLKARGGDS